MTTTVRRLLHAGAVSAMVAGAVALAASPAAAHVTVTPTVTSAGSYTVLTISVPHGCDGAATTAVSVQIPAEIVAVTPTVNPGWTLRKVMANLDPPVTDSHGNKVTQRVAEVVYTAKTPLPDDLRDKFELSLKLPDTPGKRLVFPAVQTCQQGETAWVQVPAEGQNADELEHPAPSFVVTGAASDDEAAGTDTQRTGTRNDDAAAAASGSDTTLTWVALVVGGVGVLLGGLALLRPALRSRKTTT